MPLNILTVVGARPQFIKSAVVSHEIRDRGGIKEEIIHTGQHFDHAMSQVFFDELDIPNPTANLGISGGTHATMTARMLESLEAEMSKRKPDLVLLYGDTNSTLAGALAAVKLGIPVVHVEAGVRLGNHANPEEVNRICTDHVSDLLLACTEVCMGNLDSENLGDKAHLVGDPMYDAFVKYSNKATIPILSELGSSATIDLPQEYIYLTCHREENTRDKNALLNILLALKEFGKSVVYPVHPRNKNDVLELKREFALDEITFVDPVGYLESVYLVNHAEQVVTDSGGLQREAFFAGTKCVNVFDSVTWPETMVANRNTLVKPERNEIIAALRLEQTVDSNYMPFGDGEASSKIVDLIEEM